MEHLKTEPKYNYGTQDSFRFKRKISKDDTINNINQPQPNKISLKYNTKVYQNLYDHPQETVTPIKLV